MSNNLTITQLAASQNNKVVTINDANGELDAAITETLTVTVTSTNAATVTQAQLQRASFIEIVPDGVDPPTAAVTVTVGTAFKRGLFAILNSTAETVTVEVSGQGAPPAIEASDTAVLSLNGTSVQQIGSPSSGAAQVDPPLSFAAFVPGTLTSSQVLFVVASPEAVSFPSGLSGSFVSSGTAADSQAILSIQKDGIEFGTATFSAGSSSATFASTSGATFTAGDSLSVVGPATADPTLADVRVTLKSTRT